MKDEAHWIEVDRLWRAIKRDALVSVEHFAGLDVDSDGKRWKRLLRNWDALCAHDIDMASRLAHGWSELDRSLSKHGDPAGPSAHNLRQLTEILGVAEIGRVANPDAEVETLGELHRMGLDAIRRDVEEGL